jgi:Zn-dependent peptidase ImmA (M78 family)/transcriptional regulator with XRE-family HTH domain
MPLAPTPSINPAILTWARQESGHALDRIAHRLHVPVDKVRAWEHGQRSPTVRQLQNLAEFLRRPLSLFFQPAPPQVAPLATEYRRLSGVAPGAESPELRLALRQMINRREHALNLLGELGDEAPAFTLSAHLSEPVSVVAARLRAALAIPIGDQLAWADGWLAWRTWRGAVENLGVLVFQISKVELAEVRGLSLPRAPLPVIGVNSRESAPEARVFTVLHELTHLLLTNGNEESPALRDQHSETQWTAIERFAEQVASQVIVPPETLAGLIRARTLGPGGWDLDVVRFLARRVRMTPLAMATRLWVDGQMSGRSYQTWRQTWNDYLAKLPKRSGGPVHPIDQALSRNGRPFVRLVLEALHGNRLSPVDAARYLDLKFQHFDRLRDRLLGPMDPGGADA